MKKPYSFKLEEELIAKVDAFAKKYTSDRTKMLEKIIREFASLGFDLGEHVQSISYNPNYKGAATFSKDNMDVILSHFKEFKDAQHFINKIVLNYANKAVQSTVNSNTSDTPKMNDVMKKFLVKEDKKKAEQFGISEVDTEGNPIYE